MAKKSKKKNLLTKAAAAVKSELKKLNRYIKSLEKRGREEEVKAYRERIEQGVKRDKAGRVKRNQAEELRNLRTQAKKEEVVRRREDRDAEMEDKYYIILNETVLTPIAENDKYHKFYSFIANLFSNVTLTQKKKVIKLYEEKRLITFDQYSSDDEGETYHYFRVQYFELSINGSPVNVKSLSDIFGAGAYNAALSILDSDPRE